MLYKICHKLSKKWNVDEMKTLLIYYIAAENNKNTREKCGIPMFKVNNKDTRAMSLTSF